MWYLVVVFNDFEKQLTSDRNWFTNPNSDINVLSSYVLELLHYLDFLHDKSGREAGFINHAPSGTECQQGGWEELLGPSEYKDVVLPV